VLQVLIPKAKETAEKSQLKQFKKAVSSAIEKRVSEYKDRIEENEEESQKLERQLLNLRRQIDTDTRAHKALDGTKGQWKKKAQREFAYLHRLTENLYKSIRVDGEKIIAKTSEVTINYDGYEYDVGEFEIKIDLPPKK
jgi:FKBP-type peptidyl-prolyl cis-trans isomerase